MTVHVAPTDRPVPEPSSGGPWWRQPFSVFQTNLQEIDALMDVEEVLDSIQEYGSDTWLVNTGGIVSFHPSDLPFQTRNPFLTGRSSGDLIGDAVAAAHRRGIRVIARLDFSKVAAPIAHAHPEWLFTSPEGQRQVYNTLYSACPSGDYYQHRSLDVIDEIIDRYPVDGFFFNWFNFSERDYNRVYQGVCHCANCQAGFTAYSGSEPLPVGPTSPNYPQWLRFARETLTTLSRRIADHIAARRPGTGLVLRQGAPIVYHEANNAFGRDFWPHASGEAVSAHVTARPEVAVLVNSVSFVDMPYRMAGEQPELFAQYLIQAIARGGNPSTYIMGVPGRIPYANIPLGREITRFHGAHRSVYAQLRPAATTALVRLDRILGAGPGYAEHVEEFRGAYSSLQETHHPFDVVAAEQIEKMAYDDALRRYSLIILPGVGALGSGVAAALDQFVENGGNLLVTGASGVTDEGAVELAASPAVMRFRAPSTGQALWSTYVAHGDQPGIGQYRYEAPIIPVFGSYARFVWKPGATKVGFVLPQAPYGPPEKCYGHTGSDDPGMVRGEHGAGQVIVVPWSIGRTFREFGTGEVRDHLMSAVRSLASGTVSAELPEQVELIVGRDDDGHVLHLINQSGAKRRSFGPHVPITGGRVRLRGSADAWRAGAWRAEALVRGEELPSSVHGDDLVIDLPPIELFEVVRIHPAG